MNRPRPAEPLSDSPPPSIAAARLADTFPASGGGKTGAMFFLPRFLRGTWLEREAR
jgi:hypothetical protein